MHNLQLRLLCFHLIFLLLLSCTTNKKNEIERAQLKMQLGVSYIESNNLPLALKELIEAEAIDSKNSLIQSNLGLVYFLRQKMDLALVHYSKATELNPNFTEAKNNLARVYIELKQYKKAELLLQEVISDLTYSNQIGALMNYGLMKFEQKKFNDSKNLFYKVIEIDREHCFAQLFLGRSFLELGQNTDASTQLDKSAKICLSYKTDEAHYFSAIAFYRLGLKDQSRARFLELIKLFPEGKNRKSAEKMIQIIEKGSYENNR